MIGRIKAVSPSREPGVIAEEARPGFKGRRRSLIEFSEWAPLDIADVWQDHGSRYSVQYRRLADLGLDLDALDWRPMPSNMQKPASGADPTAPYDHEHDEASGTVDLPHPAPPARRFGGRGPGDVVERAKSAIARHFGVAPAQVRISVEM